MRKIIREWNAFGSWLNSECQLCGERLFFYDKYDAVCCIACDVWFNKTCGNPKCPFCSARPDGPSEALYREEKRPGRAKAWDRKHYQHKTGGKIRHEKKRNQYAQISENKEQRKK